MADKIIRNVDQELWRQAKARAALEGITIKQLIEKAVDTFLKAKAGK